MFHLKDKKAFLAIQAVTCVAVFSIIICGFIQWYGSIQKKIEAEKKDLLQISLAYNESLSQNNIDYYDALANVNKTVEKDFPETYTKIIEKYGTRQTASEDTDTFYIPITTTIIDSRTNKVLHIFENRSYSPPSASKALSKEETNEILKGYVKNDSYNPYSNKNIMSLSVENTEYGKKQVFAYMDGENVPLYPNIEVLGKPDWSKKQKITLPFVAPQDGFIWTFLTYTSLNAFFEIQITTPQGANIVDVLRYDSGGSRFLPVNKGDILSYKISQARMGDVHFIPYKIKQ